MTSRATTAVYAGPRGSGSSSREGDPRSGWRARVRRIPGVGPCFRVGVFVAGLVLVLAGAVLWLFSVLLTLPAVFAGLYVWSSEFHWGHRLLRVFRRRAGDLWARVRARPLLWTVGTVLGVAAGAGCAWLASWLDLLGRAGRAVGL